MKRASFRNHQSAPKIVAERVREMIRAQSLRPGDLLPTYEELAETIGVGYVTVKQGLDGLAAEGLVRRVASKGTFVAKELSLQPRALVRLGVICPSSRKSLFTSSYLTEIMHGAMLGAPPHMDLHIFSLREDGLINAGQLAAERIDGVLLIGVENDDYLRRFAQWGTPGVVVDYCSQGTPLDYVACDNRAAARQVVDHLAAFGHRRVAFAVVPERQPVRQPARDHHTPTTLLIRKSSDVRERQEESLRALQEQGILVEKLAASRTLPDKIPHAEALADQFVRLADRPTALLSVEASLTSELIASLQRRGLRIPQDLTVCAVAGDRDASYRQPVVTHCRFDFNGMGVKAIGLLADRCRQPVDFVRQEPRIGFEFVAGETTAPAPRKAVSRRRLTGVGQHAAAGRGLPAAAMAEPDFRLRELETAGMKSGERV